MEGKISIVIDTDVVRSASKSNHQHAKICAAILDEMKNGDFVIAITDSLEKEWLKERENRKNWKIYMSLYAFEWYYKMKVSNRVLMIENIDASKAEEILSGFTNRNVRQKAEKDIHIILTAIETDRRIISNNIKDRRKFEEACSWTELLEDILWPHPLDVVPQWLRDGAAKIESYLLCKNE